MANAAYVSSKEHWVRRLFDTITPGYDLFNRLSSFNLDRGWRKKTIASLQLKPWGRMLDVASGTGDLAQLAVEEVLPLGQVVAYDVSHGMLVANAKRFDAQALGAWHVTQAQGRAERLPFAEAQFEAATMGFALRNVTDLKRTFEEFHRVLKPGGRLALLEFGRPKYWWMRLGFKLWMMTGIPLLGLLTTGRLWPFLYLRRSILSFLSEAHIADILRSAGFEDVEVEPLGGGIVNLYKARHA